MAIKLTNTTGAPNELYKAVSVAAGGGTETHDFTLASADDGGIVDIRIWGKTACLTC